MTTQPFEVNRSFALPAPASKSSGSSSSSSGESVGAGPRYRNELAFSQVVWEDVSNGSETRTTLRLRCLPNRLCSQERFAAELKHAGLEQAVDLFRVWTSPEKKFGVALVHAVDADGVIKVGKYFHGRRWGNSIPVQVTFAAQQGQEEVESACLMKITSGDSFAGLREAAPWRISSRLKSDELCDSEVSTEVSESLVEAPGSPPMQAIGWPPAAPSNPELAPGLWIEKGNDSGAQGLQPISFKMGAHPYWASMTSVGA